MRLLTVQSSDIASIGYDPDHEELVIVFQSGKACSYEGVPPGVYISLLTARSHGAAFAQHIKGKFGYAEIDLAEGDFHI